MGLLWIQGAQIHRQNQLLQNLSEDLRALSESIENGQENLTSEEDQATPAHHLAGVAPPRKLAVLGVQEEQDDASKELQASRDSAQKAVKEAREAPSKLSIEDNARKAEEARKREPALQAWRKWALATLVLGVLSLMARSFLRRRG
jgi:CHASE3 domain sensor protein